MQADWWENWLVRMGDHSARLREAVAQLARRMANTVVPGGRPRPRRQPSHRTRQAGIRPIGVGECLRRVLRKAVMRVAGAD